MALNLSWAGDLQISYAMDLPDHSIGPDEDVVKMTFLVTKDGKPVDANLHIILDSPKSSVLFSTDFPIVEGSRLFDASGFTENGKLEMNYMFPIRGKYTLKVKAEASDTETKLAAETFVFTIKENPGEVVNFYIMLVILVVIGLFAGFVLSKGALRKTSIGSDGMNKILTFSLLVLFVLPLQLRAHGEKEESANATTDQVTIEQNGYQLTLRLVPQSALGSDTHAGDLGVLAVKAAPSPAGQNYQPTVGKLAFLIAELRKDKQLVENVRFKLGFHHLEDDKDVFSVSLFSKTGKMNWGQQFFDGAQHRITLQVEPLQKGDFTPLRTQMNIGVIGIQPPTLVVFRSLLLLLTVTALAMAFAYWITFFLSKKNVSRKGADSGFGRAVIDGGQS